MTDEQLDALLGEREHHGECLHRGCKRKVGPYYSQRLRDDAMDEHERWFHLGGVARKP